MLSPRLLCDPSTSTGSCVSWMSATEHRQLEDESDWRISILGASIGCGVQEVEELGLRLLDGFGWIEGILDGSHALLLEVTAVRDHLAV